MSIREALFPYCMEKQEDGTWVFLNRDYKPVGMITAEFINYNEHPVAFHLRRLDKKTLAKLSIDNNPDDDRIYFYEEKEEPTSSIESMNAYLKRLEIIMELT